MAEVEKALEANELPADLSEAKEHVKKVYVRAYHKVKRRLVKRLKEVNAAAANQTLLDALLSYTMARFMVEGFEYQASVAFTGDASVWLDRHEVSSELFSWRELGGRGLIDAKCDVEMLTFVKEAGGARTEEGGYLGWSRPWQPPS